MNNQQEHDTYIIPPNFIDTGTFFGGLFKARNVIEAGIISAAIGLPVFFCLPYSLTTRIVILCLTALPLALVALIGIDGESLSAFLLGFLRFCHRRRIVGGTEAEREAAERRYHPIRYWLRVHLRKKPEIGSSDINSEILEEDEDTDAAPSLSELESGEAVEDETEHWRDRLAALFHGTRPDPSPACMNPVADYLPIQKIENGIVHTKDGRYLKIVEVEPVNFLLRSAAEQRGIIYSFLSWLKISPVRLQCKVLTRRAEIGRHIGVVRRDMERETSEPCRRMQEDYLHFVGRIGSREAVTRRFFLIFEYEPFGQADRGNSGADEAAAALQSAVNTAANYLRQCGNRLLTPENEDEAAVEMLYSLLCRTESAEKPLAEKVREVTARALIEGRDIDHIPAAEFFAPGTIDLTRGSYICIDGLY